MLTPKRCALVKVPMWHVARRRAIPLLKCFTFSPGPQSTAESEVRCVPLFPFLPGIHSLPLKSPLSLSLSLSKLSFSNLAFSKLSFSYSLSKNSFPPNSLSPNSLSPNSLSLNCLSPIFRSPSRLSPNSLRNAVTTCLFAACLVAGRPPYNCRCNLCGVN